MRSSTGTRGTKASPVEGDHSLFGFLTTDANAVVRPVHAKAMPVILTTAEQMELWMSAPADEALSPQRPHPLGRFGSWRGVRRRAGARPRS
jgi:putative SOS response-associated peptidase YedK